ncbi:MAG: hypothetical protein M3Z56_10210 [Bacteroidota bacterium]|nr:hypothetical protein [Bacteroidota bacterium]
MLKEIFLKTGIDDCVNKVSPDVTTIFKKDHAFISLEGSLHYVFSNIRVRPKFLQVVNL